MIRTGGPSDAGIIQTATQSVLFIVARNWIKETGYVLKTTIKIKYILYSI